MNIHHLELFYYVARHGGIMEAVRNMPYGIQQPAVSGQILQLESDLGLKLFTRRPFRLLPPGVELFEFIRPFFEGIGRMEDRLRGGAARTLRMAAPALVLRRHLPEVLAELRARHPGLKVHLREAHQPQVERWLGHHEVDFAITVLEGTPPAGVRAEPLAELPVGFLVPRASRVRDAAEVLETLAGDAAGGAPAEPLITLPEEEVLPRRFRALLALRELDWPTAIEVSSLDLVEVYVANGFGVGVTAGVPGQRVSAGLRFLPIPGIEPLRIGALWQGEPTLLQLELLARLQARARALADSPT